MKKALCLVILLGCMVECSHKEKRVKLLEDKLVLASVTVDRTFTLVDSERSVQIPIFGKVKLWDKSGDRIAIYRTASKVFTAYVNLQGRYAEMKEDGKWYVVLPEPKLEKPYIENIGDLELRFKSIDKSEGRKEFSENEITKRAREEYKAMDGLLKDEDFRNDLIDEAKKSAQTKLCQFVASVVKTDVNNVIIEFEK